MPTFTSWISSREVVSRVGSAGFSLLELLVVVTIIGIFAGAAVLSMGALGSDRELEREALRLRGLVDLMQEEAILESRDYGILFAETGYRFYVYDYRQLAWLPVSDDRLLREYALTEPLRLALDMDDREVLLAQDFEARGRIEQPEPQVTILASGELTPFEVAFYRDLGGGRFLLDAKIDGSTSVTRDGFQTP
jgi:general secretion pathway protein H